MDNNEKRSFEVRRIPQPDGSAWARMHQHGCSFCCRSTARAEWIIVGNFGPSYYICTPCAYALRDALNGRYVEAQP